MSAIILALALTRPCEFVPIVDRVEINTILKSDGEPIFTQVILWRWAWFHSDWYVAQWFALRNGYHQRGDRLSWVDDSGREYRVRFKQIIHTRGHDREIENRKLLREPIRIPYLE